jgi:hypothetical protein
MSRDKSLDVSLDLEDFTPRQLRKLLSKMAHRRSIHELSEDDKDEADKANDDLVSLHESHTGDSKPPKVKKDDLPLAENDLDPTPEEEAEDEDEMIARSSKKARKS